jgi:hypothetical protein
MVYMTFFTGLGRLAFLLLWVFLLFRAKWYALGKYVGRRPNTASTSHGSKERR